MKIEKELQFFSKSFIFIVMEQLNVEIQASCWFSILYWCSGYFTLFWSKKIACFDTSLLYISVCHILFENYNNFCLENFYTIFASIISSDFSCSTTYLLWKTRICQNFCQIFYWSGSSATKAITGLIWSSIFSYNQMQQNHQIQQTMFLHYHFNPSWIQSTSTNPSLSSPN